MGMTAMVEASSSSFSSAASSVSRQRRGVARVLVLGGSKESLVWGQVAGQPLVGTS